MCRVIRLRYSCRCAVHLEEIICENCRLSACTHRGNEYVTTELGCPYHGTDPEAAMTLYKELIEQYAEEAARACASSQPLITETRRKISMFQRLLQLQARRARREEGLRALGPLRAAFEKVEAEWQARRMVELQAGAGMSELEMLTLEAYMHEAIRYLLLGSIVMIGPEPEDEE